jgi:hypothetical protein
MKDPEALKSSNRKDDYILLFFSSRFLAITVHRVKYCFEGVGILSKIHSTVFAEAEKLGWK